MEKYEEPQIIASDLVLEDIIMISNENILGEILDEDGEVFPNGN